MHNLQPTNLVPKQSMSFIKAKIKNVLKSITTLILAIVSTACHWFFWTKRNEHISLLRCLIASSIYGLTIAGWFLLGKNDHEDRKAFLEMLSLVFAIISVLEIADGVVLPKTAIEELKGPNAITVVPSLLIDASQKCKIGLVFAIYGWLADLVVKHLLDHFK